MDLFLCACLFPAFTVGTVGMCDTDGTAPAVVRVLVQDSVSRYEEAARQTLA